MDSVTQFGLGASVTALALGKDTPPLRAMLWGGIVATLPDLDVLFDHGDAVRNMTMHRGVSHAIFWQTLATPLLAWGIAALHRERARFGRWCVAVWLALVTHALLDAMTVYGTRLLLPFDAHPFAVGSLFVIDPLYTLPLCIGLVGLWWRGAAGGRAWNVAGLVLSTLYAAWSVAAQQQALAVGEHALAAQGIAGARLLATPAPLQTMLWRLVAVTDDGVHEAFWSRFDGDRAPRFETFPRGKVWFERVDDLRAVRELRAFSGGFVKAELVGRDVRVTDVRMGQEPHYVFTFVVAKLGEDGNRYEVAAPQRDGSRIDVGRGLAWLWPRMWGADLTPPR
jgi:inner membrane protein